MRTTLFRERAKHGKPSNFHIQPNYPILEKLQFVVLKLKFFNKNSTIIRLSMKKALSKYRIHRIPEYTQVYFSTSCIL